ncbi:unnamed protein product, partial [Iphiclides podalirius]
MTDLCSDSCSGSSERGGHGGGGERGGHSTRPPARRTGCANPKRRLRPTAPVTTQKEVVDTSCQATPAMPNVQEASNHVPDAYSNGSEHISKEKRRCKPVKRYGIDDVY